MTETSGDGHVLGEALRDLLPQFDRRQPGRADVVDQRQRDHAVGTDRHHAAQFRVLPHLHVEDVLGSDAEGVRCLDDARRRRGVRSVRRRRRGRGRCRRRWPRCVSSALDMGATPGAEVEIRQRGRGPAGAPCGEQTGGDEYERPDGHRDTPFAAGRLVGRQNRAAVTRRDGQAYAKHVPQYLVVVANRFAVQDDAVADHAVLVIEAVGRADGVQAAGCPRETERAAVVRALALVECGHVGGAGMRTELEAAASAARRSGR